MRAPFRWERNCRSEIRRGSSGRCVTGLREIQNGIGSPLVMWPSRLTSERLFLRPALRSFGFVQTGTKSPLPTSNREKTGRNQTEIVEMGASCSTVSEAQSRVRFLYSGGHHGYTKGVRSLRPMPAWALGRRVQHNGDAAAGGLGATSVHPFLVRRSRGEVEGSRDRQCHGRHQRCPRQPRWDLSVRSKAPLIRSAFPTGG